MSNPALNWVWAHSESKGASRLVMLSLADSARKTTRNTWPSISTLAKRTKLTERAVRLALRELEKLGEIVTHPYGGPNGTNLYHVVNTERDSGGNGVQGEEKRAKGGKQTRQGGEHSSAKPKSEPSGTQFEGHFVPGSGYVEYFPKRLKVVSA